MTNFGSIAGGAIWVAVASLLMFATFAPVPASAAVPAECETKTKPLCMDPASGTMKQCPLFRA